MQPAHHRCSYDLFAGWPDFEMCHDFAVPAQSRADPCGWGNLKTFTQDPDSSITGGSGRASYAMTWTYLLNAQTGCNRSLYLGSWTQPDGTSGGLSLGVTYAAGLDAYVRRVSNTYDDKTVYLAEYKYLGAAGPIDFPCHRLGRFGPRRCSQPAMYHTPDAPAPMPRSERREGAGTPPRVHDGERLRNPPDVQRLPRALELDEHLHMLAHRVLGSELHRLGA